jgi:hypothetical protein
MNHLVLNEQILSWGIRVDAHHINDSIAWRRPYEYFHVAESILGESKEGLKLIDVISNLKRAINYRIKNISEIYHFKSLNKLGLPEDVFSKLELLGIARPAILRTITSIRNSIEHQFKDPPESKRCREFVDVVWYFLKSTDDLCKRIARELVLNCEFKVGYDSAYWLGISFKESEIWETFEINGWVLPEHVQDSNGRGIPVVNGSISSKQDLIGSLDGREEVVSELLKDKRDDAIYISGTYNFEKKYGIDLLRLYFSLSEHD